MTLTEPAEPVRVEEEGEEPGAGTRRAGWRWLAIPLSIFAGTRIAQLLLLDWMMPHEGPLRDRLLSWDVGWFLRVAENGYPTAYQYTDDGALVGNGLAFFPMYPLMIRAAHVVFGLPYDSAALTISWLAAAVAAVLIFRLGEALYGRRAGVALTILVFGQPMSLVLSMAYSEAVFIAFVAGALLATYRHRWIVAGLLGLGASLTRPTGAALALALGVGAIMHVADRRNGPGRWRALAGAALAGIGVPAYLAWVGWRIGEASAWFKIQTAGWGTRFDYGDSALTFVRDALRGGEGWVQVSVAWILIAATIAIVVAVRQRVWVPLLVYGVVAVILVLGQAGYYHSKPRLLVPVIVTLVPAATALGRAHPRTAAAVLAGFTFFGLWYGAYLVTVWHHAI